MSSSAKTSAQIIIEEVRRQVDLQVSAAEGLDTKAMAIFAGVAALRMLPSYGKLESETPATCWWLALRLQAETGSRT